MHSHCQLADGWNYSDGGWRGWYEFRCCHCKTVWSYYYYCWERLGYCDAAANLRFALGRKVEPISSGKPGLHGGAQDGGPGPDCWAVD